MIGSFESLAHRYPQKTCFTYSDEVGSETTYSYREVRMLSSALALHLQSKGVQRGDCVAVDLSNCPLYALLILAAAYGNFVLVAINNRLADGEKLARALELERCTGSPVALRIDSTNEASLLEGALGLLSGEASTPLQQTHNTRAHHLGSTARSALATATPRSARALGRANSGAEVRRRRSETQRQNVLEEVMHFAERSSHVFNPKAQALIMFTSGTTGKPKAVPLTWDQVCSAAQASNATLNRAGEGLWQIALPFYHVGGFQVVIRSFLGGTPFVLYRQFSAERLLADVPRFHATHVSVVDKMLQDLLDADRADVLKAYRCILLGGGATNPRTLERAVFCEARVYVSYGMTETSSQIAHAQVTPSFDGGLRLLPGYEVRIVDPDECGYGRLAVRGPGVFEGYLNARAAYTVDGFFLTGDTAAYASGRLYAKERTADMFVSGGENVYPAEIREKLMSIPGIADAYVFGAPDATWGRRPVAFVEYSAESLQASVVRDTSAPYGRAALPPSVLPPATPQQFAVSVQASLVPRLSKLYRPRCVCVLREFPRIGIGKVDRVGLEALYECRIEIARVVLHRIKLPFKQPFKTAKGVLYDRESVIIEVEDHVGRIGLGECVAFSTDWYLPETLDQDIRVLQESLIPRVLSEVYFHPSEVSSSFATCEEAAAFPLAQGALEPALWDLYGKIVQQPLWKLIGGAAKTDGPQSAQGARGQIAPRSEQGLLASSVSVPAGAVIGMASVAETLDAVSRCLMAGYDRVKLKVAPGHAAVVRAVRAAYPHLVITLDANQSFAERDMDELRALDACGVAWIEEPLDPKRTPVVGPRDIFARLARLQRTLRTPLCLDESIAHPRDLARALQHPELRCYALKIAKMGGVQPSLDFMRLARHRGLTIWMGGMYDTGVSKRLHAAFETLPGVEAPGDIGSTSRYFDTDISTPPYTAERGLVTLNRAGYPHGLGCDLNRPALEDVLVDRAAMMR